MDLGPLRDLALALNFDAHGIPITIQDDAWSPISTRGIWLTPVTEAIPAGAEFARSNARQIMAIRKDAIEGEVIVARTTKITAPKKLDATSIDWLVDGVDESERDHFRLTLLIQPEGC